ncbi:hypothetical protein C0J52_11187, partial [Blattella germanica]
ELEKVIGFTKVHIKEERDLALEENDCWDPYQAKEFQPKLLKEEKVWTSVNDDLVKDCDDKPNLDINEESGNEVHIKEERDLDLEKNDCGHPYQAKEFQPKHLKEEGEWTSINEDLVKDCDDKPTLDINEENVSQTYNSSDETNSKEELPEGIPSADSPIKCEICDKSFDQNRYLKTHMLTHTDKHPFQCEICKKNFTLKKYLKSHMIIHTQNRTFECTICHKSFFYKHSLTHHMVIHNEVRFSEFQCEICSKHFFEKRYLDRHMITHRFDQPFQCNICSKCFSRKGYLNRHLITHGNDRPFQCQQCSKSFSRKSALTAHLVTHTGDRPFQCKICKKSFSFASSLSSHTHIDSLQFQCELCKKSFCNKSSLTRHMRTHSFISL